jgi:hypothetical protein
MHEFFPSGAQIVHRMWRAVLCGHCRLRCAVRRPGQSPQLSDVDVLLDAHWALNLSSLDAVPNRLIFYHWDAGKLGKFYHFFGNLLETVGTTERFVAQARRRPDSAMTVRLNQEMRSGGGFVFSARKSLRHLGLSPRAISTVIRNVVAQFEANFTRELVQRMAQFKAG